jgi:hypothetical protein
MTEPRPSVDDLRARLRELGYLDAGVDRFVLGAVRGGRGFFSVAARSSARIGLLAALLVGPSAALALGVRLPGLVTGVRDGVVLAAYLGTLFGLGVALLSLAAMLLLGLLAARAGSDAGRERAAARLANAAGGSVGMACLAYLVLWWRTVSPAGTVWSSLAWTWPVLACSAAISMLLGHTVRVATLAFAAGRLPGAAPVSFRLRSRPLGPTLGLGLTAFVVGALILFVATRGEDPAAGDRSERLPAASPTGVTLTVVAVDGLDLPFLEPLLAANRLPHFARLLGGARMSLPASDAPDPARTWTSLATGQGADVHGVSGIEARAVSGMEGTMPAAASGLTAAIGAATDLVRLTRPAATSALQRRSKTFWEVASDCGLSTAVVNWWATWPAPAESGVVITDRATLRLERGGELDAELAPPSLYATLKPGWPNLRDDVRRRIVAAFEGLDEQAGGVMRRAAEQDGLAVALAARVFTRDVRLRAVYLPGLDIAQYNLIGAAGGAGLPASALAARLETLQRYYQFLDAELAPIVDNQPPGAILALVSDPGRSAVRGDGVLALVGESIRPDVRASGRSADVAPTLLYVLGVPISRQLPGRVRTDLLVPALVSRAGTRRVDTYGHRVIAPRPPAASPLDREMLERLRSLGYVR